MWLSGRKKELNSLLVPLPPPHSKVAGIYGVTTKHWIFYRQYLTQLPHNLALSHFTVGETVWKKLKILPKVTWLKKTQIRAISGFQAHAFPTIPHGQGLLLWLSW